MTSSRSGSIFNRQPFFINLSNPAQPIANEKSKLDLSILREPQPILVTDPLVRSGRTGGTEVKDPSGYRLGTARNLTQGRRLSRDYTTRNPHFPETIHKTPSRCRLLDCLYSIPAVACTIGTDLRLLPHVSKLLTAIQWSIQKF